MPGTMGTQQIVLRLKANSTEGPAPGDWLLEIVDVTLDANGQGVIQLNNTVRDGATVHFLFMNNTITLPKGTSAGTFGTGSIAISAGGLGVSVSQVSASGSGQLCNVAVYSTSKTAGTYKCLLLYNANDEAPAGQ